VTNDSQATAAYDRIVTMMFVQLGKRLESANMFFLGSKPPVKNIVFCFRDFRKWIGAKGIATPAA
jgi:hypothetical protein